MATGFVPWVASCVASPISAWWS